MESWKTTLRVSPAAVRLLVRTSDGHDILKAQLPNQPDHPRALLTLLEGLALWSGRPLCVAMSAAAPVSHSLGLGPFGDEWPASSALISFDFTGPDPRGRRIRTHFHRSLDATGSWREL